MISSGDLITIGPRKKTKHVQIAQPVSIGQSSGTLYLSFVIQMYVIYSI